MKEILNKLLQKRDCIEKNADVCVLIKSNPYLVDMKKLGAPSTIRRPETKMV